jgi:hypothetical protein
VSIKVSDIAGQSFRFLDRESTEIPQLPDLKGNLARPNC